MLLGGVAKTEGMCFCANYTKHGEFAEFTMMQICVLKVCVFRGIGRLGLFAILLFFSKKASMSVLGVTAMQGGKAPCRG